MVSEWEMLRTEQICINGYAELSNLCHLSKNLWNEAYFLIRQPYFHNKFNPDDTKQPIPNYSMLAGTLKISENYKGNAQGSQQLLKLLVRSWTSYWNSLKDWSKHPDKYLGKPKMPYYKAKNGEMLVIFTNQQCSIKDGLLMFPKSLDLKPIKTRHDLGDLKNLREVRIVPKGTGYVCEIVYERLSEEGVINRRWYSKHVNENRILGIDLGIRNIVSMGNNIGETPIIVKGGILKNINQFYNKRKADLQVIYDGQGIKNGKAIKILTERRNRKIKDQMHKMSRFVVDYCMWHNIGTVVIGKNDGWKQEVGMGKRNNQNFVNIPHAKLIHMLSYKLNEMGIKVILQEESYTSKCSFVDFETIEHHEPYIGKRLRGLFYASKTYNSDVNGALNIIRKAIPKAFNGIEDVVLHPKCLNINKIISFEGI
jgi:putative transposase